jgi:hypothetical protein
MRCRESVNRKDATKDADGVAAADERHNLATTIAGREHMEGNGRLIVSILGLSTIVSVGWPSVVRAQRLTPVPHPIGDPEPSAAVAPAMVGPRTTSRWTPLTNRPGLFNGASNPILLTDGTVLVQDSGFPDWWRLTPDETGSYVNGTWSEVASLPAGYSPLYHSSAVLPDGRLIIEGGEYLLSDDHTAFVPSWTAKVVSPFVWKLKMAHSPGC